MLLRKILAMLYICINICTFIRMHAAERNSWIYLLVRILYKSRLGVTEPSVWFLSLKSHCLWQATTALSVCVQGVPPKHLWINYSLTQLQIIWVTLVDRHPLPSAHVCVCGVRRTDKVFCEIIPFVVRTSYNSIGVWPELSYLGMPV